MRLNPGQKREQPIDTASEYYGANKNETTVWMSRPVTEETRLGILGRVVLTVQLMVLIMVQCGVFTLLVDLSISVTDRKQ